MYETTPPEKITIIEGPTPTFETPPETWALSFSEGPSLPRVAVTRLRTFNGPALVERCWKAWNSGRACNLEFRNEEGLTQEAPIVAVRAVETQDGQVLLLHVRVE
ncbi:MAG TPA: hypothetical protein PLC98_01470 [Anaerolineales bacterium]|nr:hypothetical protein [Anaerolineales bacterium]